MLMAPFRAADRLVRCLLARADLRNIATTIGGVTAVALLLSGPVAGQSGPWLVRDVRLFDGETVIERSSVVVDAGRITYLGHNPPLTADMQIVEGSGMTLLPASSMRTFTPAYRGSASRSFSA
jgi:hypothetical protein